MANNRDDNQKESTVRALLEVNGKATTLGSILYKAARNIVAISHQGVMPKLETLTAEEKNSRIIMSYALSLVTRGENYDSEEEKKFMKLGLFDVILPRFATEFLKSFPTLSLANEKFGQSIPLTDFFSQETRAILDQILNMTIQEAGALIKATPLLEHWKAEFASLDGGRDIPLKQERKTQKRRYRLTKDEIKRRKKIVKEANKIFKESDPKKTWKQIAYELDIPERTLRDWRHNPIYS